MRPRSDRVDEKAGPVSRVADGLLALLAIAGLASTVWWIASVTLGVGLVSFATGSMTPRYPVGSVAVSVPVALDAVRIGDVVTVQRGGDLPPITHRVVAVTVPPSAGIAVVRLKGDANRVEDPRPYRVRELRRVVLPLPPMADALRFTSSPAVGAVLAALIVGSLAFAFWPERIRPRHRAPSA